jgi:hypothetical protein
MRHFACMPAPAQRQVLVVDDDPTIRVCLTVLLESVGYDVATATMISRQCPECGGELVLARRSDEQGAGFNAHPSNYWRCSICGGEFTAEQLRANKRSKQFEVARRLDQPLVNYQIDDGSSSQMGDEGCPNESPSVQDATGYSIEEEEGESMAEEAS